MFYKHALVFIVFLTITSTYVFSDQLPEPVTGTANGIIIYKYDKTPEDYSILDFQGSKALRGHFCSCHIGNTAYTTSGETVVYLKEGDELSITIKFPDNERFVSEILDEEYLTITTKKEKENIYYISRINKTIELKKENEKDKKIYIELDSIIIFCFTEVYEDNFK